MINIIVNTKFSAIHFWPDCDIVEVSYLKYYRRHEFHVKAKAPVTHENRDIEFIQLKNKIDTWISDNWDKKNLQAKSCEMMCTELMFAFPKLTYVRVLEDGENGSRNDKGIVMFSVYDKVWIILHNKPKKMIVFAVIDSMNHWKTGTERTYRLVESRIGTGWGNNEGLVFEENQIFKTKEDLLKSL